ncbi:hypothetical protein DCC62_10975 [candidate division KSB1 bacterium]|nr:MAG: hypothetical protein DCC62_10975 [candidate division KSB1 bacterium]
MKRQELFSIAMVICSSLCFIVSNALGQASSNSQLLGLPPGFDCEVVIDASQGLALPHHLDFDSQGNLYISTASPSSGIARITPSGSATFSSTLLDPDGVAVDGQDNIFVAGGDRVTLVQSFTGGSDTPFASGFTNLDAIAIDSQGNLVVLDNEFYVKKISRQTGAIQLLYTVSGHFTGDVEFNNNDELFISANTPGQIIKIDAAGNAENIIPASPALNPGFGALEFGPGGAFGSDLFIVLTEGSENTIMTVGANGQLFTFAQPAIPIGGLTFSPSGELYVSEITATGRIFRIFPTATPDCVPSPSGLVGWWPGEGDASDIQNGNHGILLNGATFVAGKVGQAFKFDGINDYVSLPPNSGTGDFTIEFWEKSSSNALYRVALGFAASASPATSNLIFDFNDPDLPGGVGLWVYWNGSGANRITTGTIGTFTNGQWHHIALTRSGPNMTLYVNGASVGSTVYAPAIDLSNFDVTYIGASAPNPGNFWDGSVDEVSIYSRALSVSEIQSIYNAGGVGKCTECTPPEVSITGDDPVCPNSTQTYTATTDAANPAFAWSVTGGTINGDNTGSSVSVTAGGVGAMMVSVEVTDGTTNCSNTVTREVTVEDAEAPVITPATNPIMLWPPNHKYVTINLSQCVAAVSDNCADLTAGNVMISKVTSDEPEDALGGGDGNTENDIVIAGDCQSVQLRSERLGSGNGRVYTIHLSLNDGNGNVGTATRLVTVPKSQNGNPAVDNGIAYEVMSDCNGIGKLSGNTGYTIEHETLPEDFALFQNYPNPFNPTTEISFALPEASDVTLAIYNSSGQLVRLLASGQKAAGRHSLVWDAKDQFGVPVASGVYLYTLKAGNFVAQRKLILMK